MNYRLKGWGIELKIRNMIQIIEVNFGNTVKWGIVMVKLIKKSGKFNFILTARIKSNYKPKLTSVFDSFPIFLFVFIL